MTDKPSMVQSWWVAHELEIVISIMIFGLAALIWLIASLADAARERSKKKKDGIL